MKRFRNIKPTPLITNVLITVAYPLARAITYEGNKLTIFLDSLTIISFILMFFGVFYHLYLKGDFDRIQYYTGSRFRQIQKPFDAYREDRAADHAAAFNYPLWLGLLYFFGSAIVGLLAY